MKTDYIDNRQIRVFISSTFRDMQDERDYLMKRTFPKLRKLAADRDVTLTELDLRWGITEEESKSGKVVEICLREIENSVPFFIGIIGNRYGWVPDKQDLGEDVIERFHDVSKYLEQHLSVTEMEMQFGVLNREEDMHAYFYLKEEIADADNPEMLELLKQKVMSSHYPSSTYSSPENLAEQVEHAFISLLDQLFPKGDLTPLEKERIGQRSYMNQLCQTYIRKDEDFRALDQWMSDWAMHQLVVTGASGLGKSALLANWVKEKLSDKDRDYNIIYHFTGNGGSESNHEYVIRVLSDEIADQYALAEDETATDKKLDDLFLRLASEGKKPLLIVLDAINQILDIDNAKLLNWLPIPPKNVKILFSTLQNDRTMEVFQNRNYPIFTLQPLSIERRKELVVSYLHQFAKALKNSQIDRIVSDRQCENTLVLKTVLDELVNFGQFEMLDEKIEYYLSRDTIDDFYQSILANYEEEYNVYANDFVKRILSLIILSKNGLSEDALLGITQIQSLYWSSFFCSFINHLTVRNGMINISHSYLRNAIEQRYFTKNCDWEISSRQLIAKYFKDSDNKHSYSELAYQYLKLSDHQKLHSLLLKPQAFVYLFDKHKCDLRSYWNYLKQQNSLGYSLAEYEKQNVSSDIEVTLYDNLVSFCSNEVFELDQAQKYSVLLCARLETLNDEEHLKRKRDIINRLGLLYRYVDAQKAKKCFEEALRINRSISETETIDDAKFYNNLSILDLKSEEAIGYVDKGIKIIEALNKQHSTIYGFLLSNKAAYLNGLGRFEEATRCAEESIKVRLAYDGSQSDALAQSYRVLGTIKLSQGNYLESIRYAELAKDIEINVYGYYHPRTGDAIHTLAESYYQQSMFDKAKEYFVKEKEVWDYIYGPGNTNSALVLVFLGNIYNENWQYEEALDAYQKALKINRDKRGELNDYTLTCRENIANVKISQNHYEEGKKEYKDCLSIREEIYGKTSIKLCTNLANLARVELLTNDYEAAILHLSRSLSISQEYYGGQHPQIAMQLHNLAFAYSKLEKYDLAIEYEIKAIEMSTSFLGEKHAHIACYYRALAEHYANQGNCQKELENELHALEIYDALNDKPNRDIIDMVQLIAVTYRVMHDNQKAIDYAKRSVELCLSLYGRDHYDTAYSYNLLGGAYNEDLNNEEALRCHMESYQIWSRVCEDPYESMSACKCVCTTAYWIKKYALSYEYCQIGIEIAKLAGDEDFIAKFNGIMDDLIDAGYDIR